MLQLSPLPLPISQRPAALDESRTVEPGKLVWCFPVQLPNQARRCNKPWAMFPSSMFRRSTRTICAAFSPSLPLANRVSLGFFAAPIFSHHLQSTAQATLMRTMLSLDCCEASAAKPLHSSVKAGQATVTGGERGGGGGGQNPPPVLPNSGFFERRQRPRATTHLQPVGVVGVSFSPGSSPGVLTVG